MKGCDGSEISDYIKFMVDPYLNNCTLIDRLTVWLIDLRTCFSPLELFWPTKVKEEG